MRHLREVAIAGCTLAYDVEGTGPAVLFIQGVGIHGAALRGRGGSAMSVRFTCIVVLLTLALARSGHAQVRDSAVAAARATAAAQKPPVALYFIGGFIAAPMSIATGAAIMTGADLKPWMAVGPVGGILMTSTIGVIGLPTQVQAELQQSDSMFVRVYITTYERTLMKRRRSAVSAGALLGTIAGTLLLIAAFSGY